MGRKKNKDKRGKKEKSGSSLVFEGIKYVNELEVRMAKILHLNGIKFEYSKRFHTMKKKRANTREVDFWLTDGEIEVKLFKLDIDPPQEYLSTRAIEVKTSCRRKRDEQQKELHAAGIITFIATKIQIEYWEKYGLLRDK